MPHADQPGIGALADHVLAGVEDGREREAWRFMLDRMVAYPREKLIPAMKPPQRSERARRIVAFNLTTIGDAHAGTPQPVALSWFGTGGPKRIQLEDAERPASMVAEAMFTYSHRGALLVFPDGAAQAFAVLLRHYARTWIHQGFTIEPLTAGATLRGLIVRKDKHSWALCDLGIMAGLEGISEDAFCSTFAASTPASSAPAARLHAALTDWQAMSLEHFDAAASITVGRASIRAASRHLGQQQWLWRPHPLAVTMLRAGGGYRGGYAAAQRYSGQAWRLDINKAYTWALGQPMPSRLGLARNPRAGASQAGIWLSRVTGAGLAPLYLGVWQDDGSGFERVLWHGGDALAVLTSTEIAAVRRLGYRVVPGSGLAYLSTFTLRGFVAQVEGITRIHGRGSPQERIARAYGVSVYGKLAERPERDQVMYAAESPGEAWRAFVDDTGEEIADLWTTHSIAYRPHQHVDAASEITSLVRARLYDAIGTVVRAGGEVPHADTDGFLTSIDPTGLFDTHETAPGAWRLAEGPQQAIVWGRKGYAFGEDVRAAGLRGVTAAQAERAMRGEMVEAQMQERSAPFGSAPLYHSLRRQVRAV